MTWTLPVADTLRMPLNALALLVLRDYAEDDGWNWQSWMRGAEQHGTATDPEVNQALAEAWGWLMTHGLVARDATQGSADAYFVTRQGRHALERGLDRLNAAERLAVAGHPLIAEQAQRQFLLGEYELAVLASMKAVEVRVRKLAQASDSAIGVKLMQTAFQPGGPLADPEADPGEQVARMDLFKGALGFFKNPSSHRDVDYDDPAHAAEVVTVAALLMRLLDGVEQRWETPEP